ncbi:MAG TPA: (d)CMP kinase [Anaerolineaceae bacterium]|nr:(d)CMP kinase [Anaerolineaceae bacterium]HQL91780.1 (d)CMP kinase [Anaerolineaceae bacterium]
MKDKAEKTIPEIIAIDGPAASGKSTVGALVAEKLDYVWLDTGIMYRAVACEALETGVPIDDEPAISELAEGLDVDVVPASVDDGRQFDVLINGKDRTWEIRSNEVNGSVSEVSVYPGVRVAMTELQRKIASKGRIVVLGRDIGTVVLPDADLKIYLDASIEVRAQRRLLEELSRGNTLDLEKTIEMLRHRDVIDSTREHAPLKAAEDAILINTDHLTIEQVVDKIIGIVSDCSQA